MQHSGITLDEVRKALTETSLRLFGPARTEALKTDIEQTAQDLLKIHHFPLGFEDEP